MTNTINKIDSSNALITSYDKFSVMTYNMHGFNQGEALLSEVGNASIYDIIFIQEHWQIPVNMNKFNKFFNYSYIGVSAMENFVKRDILVGRP